MKLSLSRHKRCARKSIPWLDRRAVERLKQTAGSLDPEDAGVDLVVADDAFLRHLNREYRGIDRPTDVISFSYLGDDAFAAEGGGDATAGEICVSFETVEAAAHAQGVAPEHLFLRVGVHGLLHVVGYDHETPRDARRMESEEKRLLLEHLTPSEVEELF